VTLPTSASLTAVEYSAFSTGSTTAVPGRGLCEKTLALSVALVIASLAPLASAAETFGVFSISEQAPKIALMVGDISSQTPLDFRRMINANPQVEVIALWSDGGAVNPALLLADDIHARGLSTFIPNGAQCYSACAFLFLAGEGRVATGELGVHQFYGGEESLATAQYAVSDILEILGQFDVPQSVITQMLRTPSSTMYVFSASEIDELGLNRSNKPLAVAQEQWSIALPDFGPIITAYRSSGSGNTTATSPQPGISFALYEGVDFYGSDVAQIRASDLGQCFAACLETNQCMAITLNTDPRFETGPNCFLKSSVGRTEFYERAISGQFLFQGQSTGVLVDGQYVPAATVVPLD